MSRIGAHLLGAVSQDHRAGRARRADRRPPRCSAASATTVHMYSPSAQPNSIRKRFSASRSRIAGRARDRAGPQAADRRHAGRTSIAVKREKISRASGPAIVIAAKTARRRGRDASGRRPVAASPLARPGSPPTTSVRSAVSGHHQAPSNGVAKLVGCAIGAGARLDAARPPRLELDLAAGARRRPSRRSPRRGLLSGGVRDGDVPAVAELEAGAGGQRLALHRAARDGARGRPRAARRGTRGS